MTATVNTIDVARLVAITQALGRALELESIAADAIEQRIRFVLADRLLLEIVADGVLTEREAACALIDRVTQWMLESQSKPWPVVFDYSEFEHAAQGAMFVTDAGR